MKPEKTTSLLAGQPDTYPTALVNALRVLFSKLPAVKAAYLAECTVSHVDDRPHTVIGIAGADDLSLIVRAAGGVARSYLARGEYVDFVRIEDTTLAEYMLNETEPFYRRRRGPDAPG